MDDLKFKVVADGGVLVGERAELHICLAGFKQTDSYKILPWTGASSVDGELIYEGDVIVNGIAHADESEDRGFCVEWDKTTLQWVATCMRLVEDRVMSVKLCRLPTKEMYTVKGNINIDTDLEEEYLDTTLGI
jgi:hypothetical protein